jgi:hypothetical protein
VETLDWRVAGWRTLWGPGISWVRHRFTFLYKGCPRFGLAGGPDEKWEVNSGAPHVGFTCGSLDLSSRASPPRTSFETSTH